VDEHKDDPLDFALWKFAKPGEPQWPFEPYGAGRPGWHIECSAMARDLLDPGGTGFDIHGGGADLIFPHHENEIAQSEPLMAHPPMANFWVHGGLLLFEGRKMSKSLGNFEPLADLLERHDPQALRLLFLQTGYRKVMNFTEESVAGATVVIDRLKKAYRALYVAPAPPDAEAAEDGLLSRVAVALDDDMNTSVALSNVLAFASAAANGDVPGGGPKDRAFSEYVRALTLLGIEPGEAWRAEPAESAVPANFAERIRGALGEAVALDGATAEEAVERVVALRTAARERKDWAASDRLRDALADCGILIKDGKDGTTWTAAG
jgi:cysteinyl-tRNA synthetase